MNAIEPYVFPPTGQTVRTIVRDGEPWFVAADVCAALDLANVGGALARLDEDEKSSIRLPDGTPGNPNRAIVSEPGLYALIVRSDKPDAKAFRRWVTHEVLPAIRRTGGYSVAPAFEIPRTFAEALELAARQARELDATRETVRELEPSAAAWDILAEASGDYSVREAAQILDRDPYISTGQNRLFATLRELRWIDGKGKPYQSQVDTGRLVCRPTSYTHPHTREPVLSSQIRITVKGLKELRRILGEGGQLSVLEPGA